MRGFLLLNQHQRCHATTEVWAQAGSQKAIEPALTDVLWPHRPPQPMPRVVALCVPENCQQGHGKWLV